MSVMSDMRIFICLLIMWNVVHLLALFLWHIESYSNMQHEHALALFIIFNFMFFAATKHVVAAPWAKGMRSIIEIMLLSEDHPVNDFLLCSVCGSNILGVVIFIMQLSIRVPVVLAYLLIPAMPVMHGHYHLKDEPTSRSPSI